MSSYHIITVRERRKQLGENSIFSILAHGPMVPYIFLITREKGDWVILDRTPTDAAVWSFTIDTHLRVDDLWHRDTDVKLRQWLNDNAVFPPKVATEP